MPSTPSPVHPLLVIGSHMQAHSWRVPRLPAHDESQQADAYVTECAGKGLAVALGCHRLGAPVDLVMATGQDAAGDAMLRMLQDEALETRHVHRLGPLSGQGCGLVDALGHSTVTVFAGANARLAPQHLDAASAAFAQARYVFAQLETPVATVTAAFERAARHRATTVLNPSPWQPLPEALLRHTDILIANRREAQALRHQLALPGGPAPDSAQADAQTEALDWIHTGAPQALWQRWSGQWLIVTLGERGCAAFGRDGQTVTLAAHPVAHAHPVGAGDAFAAGLLAMLSAHQPLPQALQVANACGALAAGQAGILPALPTRAQLERFIQSPGK